jgi:threonyl-tRNA synthetase
MITIIIIVFLIMVSQLTKNPLQIANPEKLECIRHTCAHVMAMAVQILFSETKVTIEPTTDTGFYYDLDRRQSFTPEDLSKITKPMRLIIKANLPIIR